VLFETDAGDRLFHMAKKKVTPKKKVSGKKKAGAVVKKSAPKKAKKIVKKAAAKTAPKKIAAKKVARGGASAKKSTARKVRGITAEVASPMRSSLNDGGSDFGIEPRRQRRGLLQIVDDVERRGEIGENQHAQRDLGFFDTELRLRQVPAPLHLIKFRLPRHATTS